jgi:hypothetical protein
MVGEKSQGELGKNQKDEVNMSEDQGKRKAFNEALDEDSPENIDKLNLQIKSDEYQFQLKQAQKQNSELKQALKNERQVIESLLVLRENGDNIPKIKKPSSLATEKNLATAIAMFSDGHIEENVEAARVNNLNFYDLDEAKQRHEKYFVGVVKNLENWQVANRIDNLVIASLGDAITGFIHEEFKVNNFLTPVEATFYAMELIMSGFDYILDKAPVDVIDVVCCYGNHGRDVKYKPAAIRARHSYEWLMYKTMELFYKKRGEDRIRFNIAAGYHTYLNIYDYMIRFHHGDAIRFQGGVGGLSIPLMKAINQWNKSIRADLDCLGHYHQKKDYGNALVNSSLIGWNEYAIEIKGDFEEPSQTMFMVDEKRSTKHTVTPIWVKS